MKPKQVLIDEDLLRRLDADEEVRRRGRSAVLRDATVEYLRKASARRITAAYRKAFGADEGRDAAMPAGTVSLRLLTLLSLVSLVSLALPRPLAAQPAGSVAARVLEGAERQVGVTLTYDGTYRRLAYPGGDVPLERGVCTDVVVRAFRHAGIDLQVLVHEDMKRAFGAYPRSWGHARPDRSIDHRRVPNLATFFARHGDVLPIPRDAAGFEPGDVVTFRLPSGLPHIGLVSARVEEDRPLVVHNVGAGTVFEDVLSSYVVTGRYRYPRGGG